ncbi:membrane protein, putative [Renibacterium salmoninarum ATCC 33209]|uniref:Membrane protein, putative n=1 Tax=Renibacterium salmoninarum (strain ATCC 33209 / DSM 20767 / JCM 11484 / NBRC 15589 / NCIMB 2235) TaxID=288705 RepID=A9WNC0_RENSM|nr:hypothetical protein [Renibacterium salmoninarum]ABY23176.1 membrane protein, putative [Renibacterium salmoninarum ATCC 33209]
MTDSQSSKAVSSAPLAVSGPTESPWMRILLRCLSFTVPAVLIIAVIGWIVNGDYGALSALLSGFVVIVFFGISLLIGHFMGRKNPSGVFGVFAVGYVVKFVGFASVFIALGSPDWMVKLWFFISALAAVLIWLSVEILVFSRLRLQIFNDPTPNGGGNV